MPVLGFRWKGKPPYMPAGLVKRAHTGPDPQVSLRDDKSMNLGAPGSPCLPSKGSAILWPPQWAHTADSCYVVVAGTLTDYRTDALRGPLGSRLMLQLRQQETPAAWSPSKVLPGGRSPTQQLRSASHLHTHLTLPQGGPQSRSGPYPQELG